MPSSIAAARADLFARLQAAAPVSSTQAPDTVQITYGPPDESEQQEVIAIEGIEDTSEETGALGNQRREEEYVTVVGVKAWDPAATDPVVVDARGFALMEVVRSIFSTVEGRTLGGTVRSAEVIGYPTEGLKHAAGGGYGIVIRVRVRIRQRIT